MSANAAGVPTFDVLGTQIAAVNPKEFLNYVIAWLAGRPSGSPGGYICFRDVHGVVRAMDEPALASAHANALMNVPDGSPLAWLGRRRGFGHVAQVCGPDTFDLLCREGTLRGWRHAFFGSTPTVLSQLVTEVERRYPGINVVASISPPFAPFDDPQMLRDIDQLARAKADLVWVGLGSPKQELWMAEFAAKLECSLCLGVGAAFDFHAGTIKRPPRWLRRIGLEWLGRAMTEPHRLGLRYLNVVPRFLVKLAVQAARMKRLRL